MRREGPKEARIRASICASLVAHASALGVSALWIPGSAIDSEALFEDRILVDRLVPPRVPEGISFSYRGEEQGDCAREAPRAFAVGGEGQASECRLPYEIARCYPDDPGRAPAATGPRASPAGLGLEGVGEGMEAPARASIGPHVFVGPVRITGQLEAPWSESVRAVRAEIDEAAARVQGCYRRALRDVPGLRGRVVVRVVAELSDDDGRATVTTEVVKRASDIADPALLCCVEAAAQWTVYPPVAHGKAAAVYTFSLRPGGR